MTQTLTFQKVVVASTLATELANAGITPISVAVIQPVTINAQAEHIPTGATPSVVIQVADAASAQTVTNVVTAHDAAAVTAALQQLAANTATIYQRAAAALTANGTYLALATPTTAQAVAQVRTLTKECNGLIRLLLNALSDVSDT